MDGGVARLSLSMERSLLARLDALARKAGYANRSKFVADLVRERLVEAAWAADREAVGTLTLIYDHRRRRLSERLVAEQHHHHGEVLAVTHVHLDARTCVEAILIRGRAGAIRRLADRLRREKGVLHAALALGAPGRELAAPGTRETHHAHS